MKRKIIFIVPNLKCGGASKVISLICQNLNNDRYDVILVCVNMIDAFYEISNPAVKVLNLNKKHIKSAIFSIFSIFRQEKPDLVFSNGQDLNILMAIFKLLFRRKIRFICRETSVLSGNNSNIKYRRIYNFSIKKLYNHIDKIVCQSREMYLDLAETYQIQKSRLQVISNPVAMPQHLTFQSRFTMPDKIKLLSIGRLVPEKGNTRLLQAVSLLKLPFQFIILGDGPQKEDLLKEARKLGISGYVLFKGTVTDTNDYIADCDFVLLGTYNEGFPNIVLEAGILGKPVIAFKVPGVDEEVIENAVTGFLIEGNSNKDFCDAIEKSQMIKFVKDKIVHIVLSKYGINKIMSDYEKLFEQITAP
jgi:glycosyltransferase involved in cell wall biosynthesis